jgi:hypothetical protein
LRTRQTATGQHVRGEKARLNRWNFHREKERIRAIRADPRAQESEFGAATQLIPIQEYLP